MDSRLKWSCVIVTIVGLVGVACGDDDGSADEPNTALGGRFSVGGSGGTGGAGGATGRGRGFGFGGRGSFGQQCPMDEPAASETCTPAMGSCTFGTRICDCISGTNSWACWSQSDCPTSVPAEQSSCPVVGMTCSPMRGQNCNCTDSGWDCGNQFCPAAEPAVGGMCEGGDGECTYGARTCDCDSSVWSCWNRSDCPTEVPPRGATCAIDGMICPFMGGTCECTRSMMSGNMTWSCGRGVTRPDPDADAGI